MKTYKLIETENGKINIVYYINGVEELTEFHSLKDGSNKQEIKEGYSLEDGI